MRKVVDSNYLGRKELEDYLSASRRNAAVVTDYAELEMVVADTKEHFLRSTEILSKYPGQVILSKPINTASSLRGRRKGLKKRLTDGRRTTSFRKWCRARRQIERGIKTFEQKRYAARKEALAHLDDVLRNAKSFREDLVAHATAHYTREELRIIRRGKPFTPEIIAKLIDGIFEFALKFFAASPYCEELPPASELPYTFIFRFALCAYLHAFHWIQAAGAEGRRQENFRNDFIDVAFSAYATCFDGLLSNDKLPLGIYDNAVFLLNNVFLKEESQHTNRISTSRRH